MPVLENLVVQNRWLSYALCQLGGVPKPGFWNYGSFADAPLPRIYTFDVLTDTGRHAHLSPAFITCDHEKISTIYTSDQLPGVRIQEARFATTNGTLISLIEVFNTSQSPVNVDLILRTLLQDDKHIRHSQPRLEHDIAQWEISVDIGADNSVLFPSGSLNDHKTTCEGNTFWLAMGATRLPDSRRCLLSEPWSETGDWNASPLCESFTARKFNSISHELAVARGVQSHIAFHYNIEVLAGERDFLAVGACVAANDEMAASTVREDLTLASRGALNEDAIEAPVPLLIRASDARHENLFTIQADLLKRYCVHGGFSGSSKPQLASEWLGRRFQLAAHVTPLIQEALALNNTELAIETVRAFLYHQRHDGSLPEFVAPFRGTVGDAVCDGGTILRYLLGWGAPKPVVQEFYLALSRYAHYLNKACRSPITGLYRQSPAGVSIPQEFIRQRDVYSVGSTTRCYQLIQSLALTAEYLERRADRDAWNELAATTSASVRTLMWDRDRAIFADYNEVNSSPASNLYADGFLPLGTDIPLPRQGIAWDHISNSETFGAPYGIPSAARNNSDFTEEGIVAGIKRRACHSGPAWALQNTEIMKCLLTHIRTMDDTLAPTAVSLFDKLIIAASGMSVGTFLPTCWNPLTGAMNTGLGCKIPAAWSLTSLLVDALAGIGLPDPRGTLVIDPLPINVSWFTVENMVIRGQHVGVIWDAANGFRVLLNRREVHASKERTRVTIEL